LFLACAVDRAKDGAQKMLQNAKRLVFDPEGRGHCNPGNVERRIGRKRSKAAEIDLRGTAGM
jgi:hypothetical protein